MNLENQVTSLELSKQLRELGVKQESYAYWVEYPTNEYGKKSTIETPSSVAQLAGMMSYNGKKSVDWVPYSAFTVAELGEMLPPFFTLTFQRNDKGSAFVEIRDEATGINIHSFEETNEASARAKMLIHLLKAGHVKM